LLGSAVVTDLHAACVGMHGKGILLCGESGAGKSTLSYACARAGWTYTSDDTSYLVNRSRVPRVIGHAHRVRFRPAAKALFPELEQKQITPRMEGKASIEVPVAELPPMRTATETKVSAIVYLNRHASGTATLTQLPDRTATERMCDELFSAGEIRQKHERILQRFAAVPTYELRYSGLDAAIQQLATLTQSL
jgi:serine kinase of HPr protein (carbohydrate metabolism regulator)